MWNEVRPVLPISTKIIYCDGEYQKGFDELPPNVEL